MGMEEQASRLREAFARSRPDQEFPGGASERDIESLVEGFEGLHLPDELIDLLRAIDGCAEWLLLGSVGPSLSAAEIHAETRMRATITPEAEEAFCPGWVVITSEGWTHAAVVAEPEPRPRSAVLDLSYDNQAYPVVAASLTALVAARADAWEAGLHPGQTWDATEAGQRAFRDAGAEAWLSIPPGLVEGRDVSEGSRLRFSVMNDHQPRWPSGVPEDGPSHALRVIGVFET
jgi:hypothetical protein